MQMHLLLSYRVWISSFEQRINLGKVGDIVLRAALLLCSFILSLEHQLQTSLIKICVFYSIYMQIQHFAALSSWAFFLLLTYSLSAHPFLFFLWFSLPPVFCTNVICLHSSRLFLSFFPLRTTFGKKNLINGWYVSTHSRVDKANWIEVKFIHNNVRNEELTSHLNHKAPEWTD